MRGTVEWLSQSDSQMDVESEILAADQMWKRGECHALFLRLFCWYKSNAMLLSAALRCGANGLVPTEWLMDVEDQQVKTHKRTREKNTSEIDAPDFLAKKIFRW